MAAEVIKHKFGGWYGSEVFNPKNCAVCEEEFKPKSGFHKFCSEKCKGKWQYISGRVTTESQYKYISGNWCRYFNRILYKPARKDLSIKDLLQILKEQDGKCALTGVQLTCKLEKGTKFKTNASIDRIDAGGPYIKENIQLVCRAVNQFRMDLDIKEFIWWCTKVASYAKEV